jgi:hypothetical protein
MPATNFPEYAREIEDVLDAVVAEGEAALVNIQIDQRSSIRGFIQWPAIIEDTAQSYPPHPALFAR